MIDPYDDTIFTIGRTLPGGDPSNVASFVRNGRRCPTGNAVLTVHAALTEHLARPPKVLDLSYNTYRSSSPTNVNPEPAPPRSNGCDLVVSHFSGDTVDESVREPMLETVCGWAVSAGIVLFETVWDDVSAERHDEIPDELERLRDSFAFVHAISDSHSGGAAGCRVLLFCSNRYWYADGRLGAFDSWTSCHSEVVGDTRRGTRRYFFSADTVVKNFLLCGPMARDNRRDIDLESSFLSGPPVELTFMPRLIAHHVGHHNGVLVMNRLSGFSLATAIVRNVDYDPTLVLGGVLESLSILEQAGLFHNDVELWNVLINDNGNSALIDFSSITGENRSAWLPYSLTHCFFLFAQNVIHRQLPYYFTGRFPIYPFKFPRRFRRWVAMVWSYPPDRRNFSMIRDCLITAVAGRSRGHHKPGGFGWLLRSYRRILYWFSLIEMQISFVPGWTKLGGGTTVSRRPYPVCYPFIYRPARYGITPIGRPDSIEQRSAVSLIEGPRRRAPLISPYQ